MRELGDFWGWVQTYADSHIKYGPLITPVVALFAGFIAIYAISVQKQIARRRAAVDFFLKTEMDKELLELYNRFENNVGRLSSAMTDTTTMEELAAMANYPDIRGYLNIHELIAVGIRTKVLDERVCYHYWSTILVGQCNAAERIMTVMRRQPEDSAAYLEMRELKKRWEKKLARWRRAQGTRLAAVAVAAAPHAAPPPVTPT
jgi:Domain of unknown function (DUF4760)